MEQDKKKCNLDFGNHTSSRPPIPLGDRAIRWSHSIKRLKRIICRLLIERALPPVRHCTWEMADSGRQPGPASVSRRLSTFPNWSTFFRCPALLWMLGFWGVREGHPRAWWLGWAVGAWLCGVVFMADLGEISRSDHADWWGSTRGPSHNQPATLL